MTPLFFKTQFPFIWQDFWDWKIWREISHCTLYIKIYCVLHMECNFKQTLVLLGSLARWLNKNVTRNRIHWEILLWETKKKLFCIMEVPFILGSQGYIRQCAKLDSNWKCWMEHKTFQLSKSTPFRAQRFYIVDSACSTLSVP